MVSRISFVQFCVMSCKINCRVFTGNPGPRPEEMLDKISCPVLVAWGEQDPWTPLNGSVGKFFQRQVAERDNLNLVTLPKTGNVPAFNSGLYRHAPPLQSLLLHCHR